MSKTLWHYIYNCILSCQETVVDSIVLISYNLILHENKRQAKVYQKDISAKINNIFNYMNSYKAESTSHMQDFSNISNTATNM